jgi:dolichol-phosphate mannosyltransferase
MTNASTTSITYADCLVAVLTYNNSDDLKLTMDKFPKEHLYKVVVHVDGSTDGSDACLQDYPYPVIGNAVNMGVGKAIKNSVDYARRHGFKALVIIPGNNKNHPAEIPDLLAPIVNGTADYVQGSRFLGASHEDRRRDNTPLFRIVMVQVHALMFSILTGKKCTDALEGFRAYALSIFDDPDINIAQDWLDTYELETYLHYKVLRSQGIRFTEVATSKIYPEDKKGVITNRTGKKYSHIRPIIDWWRILRPLLFLLLGMRK